MKVYKHSYDRNGFVYVKGTLNGKRYRLSTDKKTSSATLKFVDTNWRSCIESILQNRDIYNIGVATQHNDEQIKLKDYVETSLKANETNRKEATTKEYRGIIEKKILPIFGERIIEEIKPSELKIWQTDLSKEGLSAKRVNPKTGDEFKYSKSFSSLWRNALKKANIAYRVFYNTRHTFASLMISKGEDILWVSKTLGHKDMSITMQRYAKFREDNRERATFLNKDYLIA